jgi:hypothetical protein
MRHLIKYQSARFTHQSAYSKEIDHEKCNDVFGWDFGVFR